LAELIFRSQWRAQGIGAAPNRLMALDEEGIRQTRPE